MVGLAHHHDHRTELREENKIIGLEEGGVDQSQRTHFYGSQADELISTAN